MPSRSVVITVPSERTDHLVSEMKEMQDIIGIQLQRGGSIQPPGDVITVNVNNEGLHELMQVLEDQEIGEDSGTSVLTTDPLSLISSSAGRSVVLSRSEATLEEMEATIGKEANMTRNAIALMAVSGIFAAVGLAYSTLHYVIAASVIAPGFLPLNRVALCILSKSPGWRKGLYDFAVGYLALFVSALVTTLLLRLSASTSLLTSGTYLPQNILIVYWLSFSFSSIFVSIAAGVAGSVLLATNRSILTAGVMIALVLIPDAALTGLALGIGLYDVALRALLRWLLDVVIVLGTAFVVLGLKQAGVHKRRMLYKHESSESLEEV